MPGPASFTVARPPGSSTSSGVGGSSNGAAAAGASAGARPFQCAAAFDDSDHEDEDADGHDARAARSANGRTHPPSSRGPGHGDRKGKTEYLTDFTAGQRAGSSSTSSSRQQAQKAVLVIPLQNNLDWRENRKKMLGLSSSSYQAQLGSLTSMRAPGREGNTGPPPPATNGHAKVKLEPDVERMNDEEQVRGLVPKKRIAMDVDAPVRVKTEHAEDENQARRPLPPPPQDASSSSAPLSAEELARKALLEDVRAEAGLSTEGKDHHSHLVISMSEEDALRVDLDHRPDAPDAAAYQAVPVEAFGAAMLRGMGWKEGMGAGRRRNGPQHAAEVQRRSALLGLGAKERPPPETSALGGNKAGGASSSTARPATARPNMRYVPVIQRERERDSSSNQASPAPSGRSGTPSAPPAVGRERERERERDRERERSPRPRDRERDRDRDRDRRDSERERERVRDYRSERDRDYERSHRSRDHDERRKESRRDEEGDGRQRERDYGRDRERDRDREDRHRHSRDRR